MFNMNIPRCTAVTLYIKQKKATIEITRLQFKELQLSG